MAIQPRKSSSWRRELRSSKLLFYSWFHGIHVMFFVIGWWKQASNKKLAGLNELTFSVWISRGAGLVLTVDGTLILLPMCRNILRMIQPRLRWLPLDEFAWFHRHIAYSMLFWTIVHTCGHYVNFFNVERTQIRPVAAVQIHYTEAAGITGHIMLLCMLLMYTTAHAKIRVQCYEAFWYTHHLFVPFMLALYTHATGCFVRDTAQPYSPFAGKDFWNHCLGYEGWRWELVGAALYLGDRLYREINRVREAEIVKVIRHPFNVAEIQFRKPSMRYKPGQWLYINVPSISLTQWHPYTITSCPHDPAISIHIRSVGDWTSAVCDAVGAGIAQSKLYDEMDPMGMYEIALQNRQEMPSIRIDGPYGAPAEGVFNNEIAILIGTGIGITPWASILKDIWHLHNSPHRPARLRRVELYWICRDITSFEWFQALLASLEAQDHGDFLRIHTYLTAKLDIDTTQNIVLNSVGTAKDPLTELRSRTNFGRPDFAKLFVALRNGIVDQSYIGGLVADSDASRRTRIGVYFCGPNVVAREVRKACRGATTERIRFKFWKEHF
ncbi:MAG: hypothetical protein M1819_002377 [Sarea resinae]|nr:MAG: hypothetical protein M1819_002377 [Sarea resinae]